LIDHPQRLPAYDEGLYPDPKNKPTGRRFKNKGRRANYPSQRNQVLSLACRASSVGGSI
jgi:hypothetical protein